MPLTYRQQFLKAFELPDDTSLSLKEIADLSGIKKSILQQVYNRGTGAWESSAVGIRRVSDGKKDYSTSRAGKMGKEAWSFGRVYSFIMGGKTWRTADSDLAALV